MNRFRSRKKSFQDGSLETSQRPSTDSDVPALPIFSSKTFRRNKKNQPEPKPQIDLATALPSSDDFRTSLLMPNLSKRFSMLREQDDPHSKMGKANDDSVLFPKRASRLDLFSSDGLKDISEDASVRAPIRPPFATSRTESYGSDVSAWVDDDRSVMSRARPGEGNTMFGGRQKIYKIPVGASRSTKSFGSEKAQPRGGMGGKALYGDDLAMSLFPKTIDHDRCGNDSPEADGDGQRRSSDERSNSPPLAKYNRNRGTTSSTNSGPSAGRISTAATSVASQRSVYGDHGLGGVPHAVTQGTGHSQVSERNGAKSRRLYGQGLDQHMYDQQHSAMHRLESIQRQRTNGGPPLTKLQGSRSATNLNDHYQRSGPLYASNEFRTASPPPSGPHPRMGDFDLGLAAEPSEPLVDSGIGRSPPLSPPMSPAQDNTFVAALEPNDLGKATASGAFNKPSKQYSEQQYLQRQLQLQQGRESPSLIRPFSPSAALIDEQVTGRSRNVSLAGPQPNSGSLLRQRQPSVTNHEPGRLAESQHPAMRTSGGQYTSAMDSSFLSTMSESEVGSPLDSDNERDLFRPSASFQGPTKMSNFIGGFQKKSRRESSPEHLQVNERHAGLREESASDGHSEITITEQRGHGGVPNLAPNHVDADSPTLGPTTSLTSTNGLNGLVRAHLRNDSGQSSIYAEPSPALQSKFPNDARKLGHSRNQSSADASATFFRDSTLGAKVGENDKKPVLNTSASDMVAPLSVRARQILEQATALRDESPKVQQVLGQNKAQRILGGEAPRPSHENSMTWQEQLRVHHTRGGSTETEKERACLANELAERRRAVQDRLQSFVEQESRSSSPAPDFRAKDPSHKQTPFGIIKSKTSKDSLASKQEQSFKAMKMLGLGPETKLTNGSPRPSQDGFAKRPDESFLRLQAQDQRQPQLNGAQSRFPRQARRPQKPESSPESFEKDPSPTTSRSSCERSGSEASERRFGARSNKPRDDVLIEEEAIGSNPTSPSHRIRPQEFSDAPRPVEELMASMANHQSPERSQSAMSGRIRSNSRTVATGYVERPDALPIQPNTPYMTTSPSTPGYSTRSAPSMHEGSSMITNESVPVMIPPSSSHGAYGSPRHNRHYWKASISKQDISEPIFKSCTASVDVVDLPPGASLKNGLDYDTTRPPIPPLNPARRKRTQTLLQALGRLEQSHPVPSSHHTQPMMTNPYQERNTFSADDSGPPRKPRHKLRKSSSEGGNMKLKARQQAMMAPSPAVPSFPQNMAAQPSPAKAHFPHIQPHQGYPPQDVPASAVMF
ncbi:MAG: hypothetical protein Q9201_004875 [Fulgogasparrea decipioides]